MPVTDATSRSNPTLMGNEAADASHYSYKEGFLKSHGMEVEDCDVILVAKAPDNGDTFTIYALAPTQDLQGEGALPPFKLRMITVADLPAAFLTRHLLPTLPTYLKPPNKVHILISTLSGTGLAPSFFESILQPILNGIGLTDGSYNVVWTKSAQSVKEFAKSVLLVAANAGRKQTVITLAGDGSIVDAVNGLLEKPDRRKQYCPPVVAQLPLGTANALFHSLHQPSTLPSMYVEGLRTLLRGEPRPLPTFRAVFSAGARLLSNEGQDATPLVDNTLYGAIVASYGLHASLVADSDTVDYRKHGDKRFGLVANDLLFPADGASPHAYKARVTMIKANGQQEHIERDEHAYILTTLVSNLERSFTISPASQPLDGQLRLVHFGSASGRQTMEVMKAAYQNGGHIGMKWISGGVDSEVGYEEVGGVRIDFREPGDDWKWRRCCIDGLIVGVEDGGYMEVKAVQSEGEALEIVVDVLK